ncbi:hypothetical protein Tco_0821734 [Tanacetum coccineum]|uniref:Uncharacterized protein n=1 Tax=Tanacetum coccineum TaxID=301880 RepID=A0ABQ5AD24_9ASTR
MKTQKALLKDADGEDVDEHLYRSMIGSLMYLTSSRPYNMFAVCACARFPVNPKSSHLHAMKRIFRYLKGQPKLGLWYPKNSPFDLVAYTNSDCAGASLDRKSITGGALDPKSIIKHIEIRPSTYHDDSNTEEAYSDYQDSHRSESYADLLTKAFDDITYYCWVTTAGPVNAVRLNLVLLVQVNVVEAALKFASSHNMVAFLDKSTESDGFEQIVDFLNAHPIKYALTVNPTIYTACIEQFCATIKVKTVNGELTLMGYENLTQKLTFYKAFFSPQWKFLIHTILQCLSDKTTAWNEFSSTMASAVICLATNQKFNFSKYIFENMVKNLEGGEKDFSGRDTPLFPTISVQAQEQVELVTDDTENVASVPTYSNNPLLSGNDRLKLNELMELYTSLSQRVLDLGKTKTSQAAEITELKERVKKLEKKGGSM